MSGPNNPDDQWSRDHGQQESANPSTPGSDAAPGADQPSLEKPSLEKSETGQQGDIPSGSTSVFPTQDQPLGQYGQPQYPSAQIESEQYSQGQYPQQGQQVWNQGQYPQSGQYPAQGQYPAPGQPGQQQWNQGQYPAQGQYPVQGQYPQPGQYPVQLQYPQQGQYPGQGQYPAPGQPGQQQWNQGQYPAQAQYSQPGQYVRAPGQSGGSAKTPLLIIGGLVAVAIIGSVFVFTLSSSKKLDGAAAEAGIEQIVTGTYGAASVSDVSCPDGTKISKGASFECTLNVDGADRSVTLTFTDDDGTYEVSRPR